MCDYEYLFVVLNNTIAMCRKDETGYCVVPIEGEPFVDFMDKKKYWSSWCESTNCDPETCLVDFVFLSNPLVEVDEISNMLAAVGFKQVEKTSWSLDAIHDALSSFKFGRPPVICAPKSVNTETKGILHLYLAREADFLKHWVLYIGRCRENGGDGAVLNKRLRITEVVRSYARGVTC